MELVDMVIRKIHISRQRFGVSSSQHFLENGNIYIYIYENSQTGRGLTIIVKIVENYCKNRKKIL